MKEPPDEPVTRDGKGMTFWLEGPRGLVKLDYRLPRILPRSTGALSLREPTWGDASGEGAFFRFDALALLSVQ